VSEMIGRGWTNDIGPLRFLPIFLEGHSSHAGIARVHVELCWVHVYGTGLAGFRRELFDTPFSQCTERISLCHLSPYRQQAHVDQKSAFLMASLSFSL
jgi:hypothetical protein